MPENILVVEYEPRYIDRVRQALNGQPFSPVFAKDGEEALTTIEGGRPQLVVLSSIIPKVSTSELIRLIRNRPEHKNTPILITISGYNGKSPKADAARLGASDILPKPYSEAEFLAKVKQLVVGVQANAIPDVAEVPVGAPAQIPESVAAAAEGGSKLTSDDIFGDLLDDDKPAAPAARKPASKGSQDLDDLLTQTLSGARTPGKKREVPTQPVAATPPTAAPAPPAPAPAAAQSQQKAKQREDLDKLLQNTLSGLEKKKPAAAPPPPPAAPPTAMAKPVTTVKVPTIPTATVEEKIPVSAPLFPPPKPEVEAPPQEEEASGLRFGQYYLKEKIATGGMAEVWKAQMKGVEGFQKIVAIKKILPHMSDNEEFVTMFIDEAKLAAQLNHNNIIHIYDLGKIGQSYYIAMEYIDGRDLKTILKRGEERGQPMQIEVALFIASKIAAALDYAHRKRDFDEKAMGLVHRDVSPQNVLISYEGDIKLCDFGIAKAASKASHTIAGALKGKLQYMSPEQAWGKPIDRRSDIFALAAVLFEMLTGRKLFTGDSELSILEQVREARVEAPSVHNDEVTPEIDRIVLKALEKDPDARYQTAGEMAKDLDAVLYSFRPTPTSADLAIYMHRVFVSGDAEPAVEEAAFAPTATEVYPMVAPAPSAPAPAAAPAPVPAPAPPVAAAPVAAVPVVDASRASEASPIFGGAPVEEKKKPPIAAIAAGIIVVLGIVGAVIAMNARKSSAPAGQQAAQTTASPTATTPPIIPAATATTATTGTTATTTALEQTDQALIDEEVKRRIAAERARLDQQQKAALQQQQQQQQAAGTAPAKVAPPPPAAVQEQPVAPVQTPPPPPPPAAVVETPPPPPPAAAQRATAREGDLVEPGTEGLTLPALANFNKPGYPPMARQRRVEGLVIIRVLVSETGRVLNAQVLRGPNPSFGINEAALSAARSATFRPATKDGVRVKSYYTFSIPFKL